jgi:hypothetical protein
MQVEDAIKSRRREQVVSIREQLTKRTYSRYLYLLLEPDVDVIRYVGCCSDPEDRYRKHTGNGACKTPVSRWIRSLKEGGNLPRMNVIGRISSFGYILEQKVVHTASLGEVVEREIIQRLMRGRWIGNKKMPSDLLNIVGAVTN